MNGMDGAQASTIHITPELGFSYASVEVFCQVCICTSCTQVVETTLSLDSFTAHDQQVF
jgi:Adenosylmethionine decarboxylase